MSFQDVSELTLFDAMVLFEHWAKYPPVRDLVAAAVGFKPPDAEPEPEKKYFSRDDMRRLMQTTGGVVPGMAAGRR